MPDPTESRRRARLETLFEAHHDAVWRYALRRVDADQVDDVVAETFLVAWRQLDRLPDAELPWLYGVARKVIANQRRANRRRERLRLRMAHEPLVYEEPDGVLADAVLAALKRLPPDDREALRLVYWEGLTPADAAVALRCTGVAMRVRLLRARRRLAAVLADDGYGLPGPTPTPNFATKEI